MPIGRRFPPKKMFREQVGTLSTWFDRWSACEQTVAMVALLRRVHPIQARFLTSVLHRQLSDCGDLRRIEILANDPNFVGSLANLDLEAPSIRDILLYLPLLNPKNVEVRSLYISFIPKILKYTLDHSSQMEDARQLLSYSLIHPAFSLEERGLFAAWLHQFEEKLASTPSSGDGLSSHYPSSCSGSPPTIIDFSGPWQPSNSSTTTGNNNSNNLSGSVASQAGLSIGNFGGTANFHRIRRSNSLTPPVLHSDAWTSQEELCSTAKPRSLSLSSEISPQSSLASSGSGSESHLDDPRPTFTAPGMRDVPSWLKSLRLHKYAFLFAHLSFEEMMTLSEIKLEAQGVTKGARHKIILSISKLKERSAHLKKVCEEMTGDKESIRNALNEIKWTLTTPMKPILLLAPPPTSCCNNETLSSSSGDNGRINNENVVVGNMAPIGTNRFQDENTITSSSSTSTSGGCCTNNKGINTQQQQHQDQNLGSPSRNNNDLDGNLSGWIVRTVGKACELNPDMECEGLLISVLDKCLSHDGFTLKQKRLLTLWRQQQCPIVRRNSSGGHNHPYFHSHHQRSATTGSPGNGSTSSSKSSRHFSPRILNLGNQLGGLGGIGPSSWSPGSSIHAMFMAKRPSLQDSFLESTRSHLSVQRTKSAPLPNFFTSLSSSSPPTISTHFEQITSQQAATLGISSGQQLPPPGLDLRTSPPNNNPSNNFNTTTSTHQISGSSSSSIGGGISSAMDITSRLESLCLSMTEAALGPAFNI